MTALWQKEKVLIFSELVNRYIYKAYLNPVEIKKWDHPIVLSEDRRVELPALNNQYSKIGVEGGGLLYLNPND